MIRSMTGFGVASTQVSGARYVVEIRSLNSKYFKAQIRLPEELQGLSPEERAVHPRLLEPIEKAVKEVNRLLADHERIRRWKLLPRELTLEAGEVTPTLKIKRRVVLERYKELVASMYLKSQRVEG